MGIPIPTADLRIGLSKSQPRAWGFSWRVDRFSFPIIRVNCESQQLTYGLAAAECQVFAHLIYFSAFHSLLSRVRLVRRLWKLAVRPSSSTCTGWAMHATVSRAQFLSAAVSITYIFARRLQTKSAPHPLVMIHRVRGFSGNSVTGNSRSVHFNPLADGEMVWYLVNTRNTLDITIRLNVVRTVRPRPRNAKIQDSPLLQYVDVRLRCVTSACSTSKLDVTTELSMVSVDPRLGCVGLGWVEIFKGFLVGWVRSWVGKNFKNSNTRCIVCL